MITTNAFVIPFLTYTVNEWKDKKDDVLSLLDLEERDGHFTDYYKYHQNGIVPQYADVLFDLLKPSLEEFDQIYPREFEIHNVWAQKYLRGGHHSLHNHGALGYSAIFYASLEEDHKPTTFYAPYVDFIEGDVIEFVPEVSEGDIAFFPSVLMHQCKPVQSDSERIIFSFNIRNK
jgi:hypothetical protein